MVDDGLITTSSVTFLLWTTDYTIGEYEKFICLKYGGYREFADRNSGTLSEKRLKEVCSGLELTLSPESKGRLGFN